MNLTFKEIMAESKQSDLIDFIKQQIKVDITDHIEPLFTNRKYITIYTNELSQNDITNIERLSYKYKTFRIETNGKDKIALIYTKK